MGANFYCYYFSRQSEASTTSTSGESDVVMAEYNLDMGRWVCPTSNAKQAEATITLSEDNQTSNMTTEIHSVNAFLNENEMKKVGTLILHRDVVAKRACP